VLGVHTIDRLAAQYLLFLAFWTSSEVIKKVSPRPSVLSLDGACIHMPITYM